jgi:hypothetical protein
MLTAAMDNIAKHDNILFPKGFIFSFLSNRSTFRSKKALRSNRSTAKKNG